MHDQLEQKQVRCCKRAYVCTFACVGIVCESNVCVCMSECVSVCAPACLCRPAVPFLTLIQKLLTQKGDNQQMNRKRETEAGFTERFHREVAQKGCTERFHRDWTETERFHREVAQRLNRNREVSQRGFTGTEQKQVSQRGSTERFHKELSQGLDRNREVPRRNFTETGQKQGGFIERFHREVSQKVKQRGFTGTEQKQVSQRGSMKRFHKEIHRDWTETERFHREVSQRLNRNRFHREVSPRGFTERFHREVSQRGIPTENGFPEIPANAGGLARINFEAHTTCNSITTIRWYISSALPPVCSVDASSLLL